MKNGLPKNCVEIVIIVHLHLVVDVVIDVVAVAVDVVAVVGGSGVGGKPFRMFFMVLKIKPLQMLPPQYNTTAVAVGLLVFAWLNHDWRLATRISTPTMHERTGGGTTSHWHGGSHFKIQDMCHPTILSANVILTTLGYQHIEFWIHFLSNQIFQTSTFQVRR